MFASLLAATLASSRGREGCKRNDWDMFVGAKCARGSSTRCDVLADTVESGSEPARGWLGIVDVGVDCVVPSSGP